MNSQSLKLSRKALAAGVFPVFSGLSRSERLAAHFPLLSAEMSELSHFAKDGSSHMVDVGGKPVTHRMARAEGCVLMQPATLRLLQQKELAKGDVLEVARLAGIMATKRTSDLIPLCHVLPLEHVSVQFSFPSENCVRTEVRVEATAKTGVEMEALTAVSVICLTIYDMCKAVDRAMEIGQIRLLEKSGGRSGHFVRE